MPLRPSAPALRRIVCYSATSLSHTSFGVCYAPFSRVEVAGLSASRVWRDSVFRLSRLPAWIFFLHITPRLREWRIITFLRHCRLRERAPKLASSR